jgi:hypothetical protein
MIRRVAGIDVGLSSAHAAVYGFSGTSIPRLLTVVEIPTTQDEKRIDACWLGNWLDRENPDMVYVENATAMGNGTVSGYLKAAGAIEATVMLTGIDWVPVMPSVWKRAVGLIGEDKKGSVRLARELFPDHADSTFKFWNSHNAAEASLIALYGAARCDLITLQNAA